MNPFRSRLLILSLLALPAGFPGAVTGAETGALEVGNIGPWGQLEWYEVTLEPPDRILEGGHFADPPFYWAFPAEWSVERIATFLERGGISRHEISLMLVPARMSRLPNGAISVTPTETAILSLDEPQRSQLYGQMAAWGVNPYLGGPLTLDASDVSSLGRLASHPFSEDLLHFANRLVYPDGAERVLADFPLLCRHLPDDRTARINLAKLLLRTRSLLVRLRVNPGTDHDELIRYWSLDYANSSALTFLESVTAEDRVGETAPIDLVHLLPPLPRQLLYSYSASALSVGSMHPDCFWTALNFFEEDFAQRLLDPVIPVALAESWLPVDPPYRFGDIILIRPTGSDFAVHACNYLADDLVFTKNGRSLYRPWIIQRREDVLLTYYRPTEHEIGVYRHRRFFSTEELALRSRTGP